MPAPLASISRLAPIVLSPGQQAEATTAAPAARSAPIEDSLELSESAKQSADPAVDELDTPDLEALQELKDLDREVRAHEAAHAAAAGPFATGGPSFTYRKGPDGQRYAVGGEVQIDTSPVEGDPEATIRKMQVVRAAALAPANPSSQDRAVAAAASRQEAEARTELSRENQAPTAPGSGPQSARGDQLGTAFNVTV